MNMDGYLTKKTYLPIFDVDITFARSTSNTTICGIVYLDSDWAKLYMYVLCMYVTNNVNFL